MDLIWKYGEYRKYKAPIFLYIYAQMYFHKNESDHSNILITNF